MTWASYGFQNQSILPGYVMSYVLYSITISIKENEPPLYGRKRTGRKKNMTMTPISDISKKSIDKC
jgi:hypothetical protein